MHLQLILQVVPSFRVTLGFGYGNDDDRNQIVVVFDIPVATVYC